MTRDDNFPDPPNDSADGDDVEILEVIGYEEEPVDVLPPSGSPDADPAELLLGFDDDNDDLSIFSDDAEDADSRPTVDEPPPPAPAARAQDSAETDLLLRLRADYDNLRKRINRERQEFELHANATLVSRLLPVVDNLERAVAAESVTDAGNALREGLAMIHRQLMEELGQEGLRAIEAVGQIFDPKLHDAVATDPTSDYPANTIIEEFQRGYLFQDRVLRHAMVRVSTNGSDGVMAAESVEDVENENENEDEHLG